MKRTVSCIHALMVTVILVGILTLSFGIQSALNLATSSASYTEWKSPTATGIQHNDWINPINAFFSDDSYAEASWHDNQDWYNFGFDIPSGSAINGIEVKIEGTGDGIDYVGKVKVGVMLDGILFSETDYIEFPATTDAIEIVGGPTDLWGYSSWSAEHFNNDVTPAFRVLLRTHDWHTIRVDHIQVRVYYGGPTNQPPYEPAAVSQYRADEVTEIPEGGETPESTVVFKGTVSDPDGDSVRLEIELRQMSEVFMDEPTPETISDYVPSGTQVTITRYGLVNADYKWQYRAKDSNGAVSDWTEFGAMGNVDFSVNVPALRIERIEPSSPIASRQYLRILGEGFISESVVYFDDGVTPDPYRIPEERTRFVDSNTMEVVAGLGDAPGQWEVWVENLGSESPRLLFDTREASNKEIRTVLTLALEYTKDQYEEYKWTDNDVLVMTAIAGGESSWNKNSAGDNFPFNCMGFSSWGLWQININAEGRLALLESLGATIDPPYYYETAKWLRDPNNNVKAAYEVWKERKTWDTTGFNAWSAYTQTQELNYYRNPWIWNKVCNVANEMGISCFQSPVNVTITDNYGRVISEVENQIPGASFEYFNATHTKVFYLPLNLTYHFQINATDFGNITISQITPLESIYEIAFSRVKFNLTSETVAEFDLQSYNANYTLKVDEDGDGLNDYELIPEVETYTTEYDIGITEIDPSRTIIGENYNLPINTTVKNYGAHSETFNVTLYVNETFVERQSVTLTNGTSATITFLWNTVGFTRGNYTISVIADPVSGETYMEDNTLIGSWVMVTILGDVDGDRDVDVFDIVRITMRYQMTYPDPSWDPNADIIENGKIDIFDVVAAAGNYLESW